MTDSIIFDVDGTLWDSTEIVAIGYNRTFAAEPDIIVRVDGERLKTLFGKPMDEIFRQLLPERSPEDRARILADCIRREEEAIEETDTAPLLYPGVGEMLRRLSERYPLYIVSNCQCGYIEQFLRKNRFEAYVRGSLCFGQTGTSKGQTILRLMREEQLSHPVYVGDTQGDADACKEAGIPFVFASYGFGDVPDAEQQISRPLDLTELF